MDLEKLEIAIRDLVKQMYHDLHGAYGGEFYEGQFEKEIQAVMAAIKVGGCCQYYQEKLDECEKMYRDDMGV